jgi:hypothetical protein
VHKEVHDEVHKEVRNEIAENETATRERGIEKANDFMRV